MPIPRLRCPGCGWLVDASTYLDYRDRQRPESHLALHLSARQNCLAEIRELGKVEWLLIEPMHEFRRCKTIGGKNREGFAKYRNQLTPREADRLAGSAVELASRNFAGAKNGAGRKDSSGEEESFPPQATNPRPAAEVPVERAKRGELPEGYVRVNGVVGRMVEVGASGLLLAAAGTVRPVRVKDAWRIGFVDAKRGGDRWSGMFEDETGALLAIGDVRYAGKMRAEKLGLHVGPLKNGGWRG